MRRFIQTMGGRVLSHVVAAALIVPSLSLGLAARRADAQLQQNPVWAVADFRDLKAPGSTYGQAAGEAVSARLGRTGRYDILPRETVQRAVDGLGLVQPLTNTNNILRVGAELRANTIVGGDIVDYRVLSSAQGKQAYVSLRVTAYDVASGIPVNGATVSAQSTVRSGAVSDETLINDAIGAGAEASVKQIVEQTLPTGTVLNTFQRSAVINQGSRSGFKTGQELIITRGRDQVATARVGDVQPSQSTITVVRSFKGLQPGDKVRVVFTPDNIVPGFDQSGNARVQRPRTGNNLSGILAVALVLGLLVVLGTGSNGSSQEVTDSFTAQATNDVAGGPTVRLNWQTNGFAKGNSQKQQWQIYRSPNENVPIIIVPGTQSSTIDSPGSSQGRGSYSFNSTGFNGQPCNSNVNTFGNGPVFNPGLELGRPYTYSIELVYALNQIDLPSQTGSSTGGGSGGATTSSGTGATGTTASTTGGTSGGGGTTGGSTGGTTGTQLCYFVSARTPSSGAATALTPPAPISPAANAVISTSTPFTFQSSASPLFPAAIEYVLQFSTSPLFTRNTTYTTPAFVRSDTGTIASDPYDTSAAPFPSFIRNATVFYYRIGARNLQDRPGPVKDPQTGLRYIFGPGLRLTRPNLPPNPPTN